MRLSASAVAMFLVTTTVTTTTTAFSPISSTSLLATSPPPASFSVSSQRLWSTLAPEPSTVRGYDDDDNNNDHGSSRSRTVGTTTGTTTTTASKPKTVVTVTKFDDDKKKKSFYPPQEQQQDSNSSTSSSSSSSLSSDPSFGPLSMDLETLADRLGGYGRARLVWDCYKVGIDPVNFHGNVCNLGPSWEDYESIMNLLPSQRRTQRLSQSTLETLQQLIVDGQEQQLQHKQQQSAQTETQSSPVQIENGVATLSYVSRSSDGTTKLLLKLVDGLQIECVIIPWKNKRSTLCISSQVGCRQGCTFCATGRMGRLRNLSTDEIMSQMFFAKKMCRLEGLPEITNVVFMGMGEASDNAENVVQATKVLTTREMYSLSASRVTVSTVGPTPSSFVDFAQSPCVLAWSVHAVDDDLRKKLVPTTKYSMAELRQGLIDALLMKPMNARTCMLEVALMKDVNDRLHHADELAAFTQVILDSVPGAKPHINLIPYNDIGPPKKANTNRDDTSKRVSGVSTPPIRYERPDNDDVVAFQKRLQSHGLYSHVRSTRGDDKTAACGQLATQRSKKTKMP